MSVSFLKHVHDGSRARYRVERLTDPSLRQHMSTTHAVKIGFRPSKDLTSPKVRADSRATVKYLLQHDHATYQTQSSLLPCPRPSCKICGKEMKHMTSYSCSLLPFLPPPSNEHHFCICEKQQRITKFDITHSSAHRFRVPYLR